MQIVVSNISKKEERDFKQRVLETMKKQIRKKLEPNGRDNDLTKVASHSSSKRNSIQQIQNQTV